MLRLERHTPGGEAICDGIGYANHRHMAFKPNEPKAPELSVLARVTIHMVALAFDLEQPELLNPKRGTSKVCRARQVAAYLLNTTLSLSLVEIGRLFGKDRTTIGYACRLVEDLRDDPAFDDRITELGNTIRLVVNLVNKEI